jgi:hypothetical protein
MSRELAPGGEIREIWGRIIQVRFIKDVRGGPPSAEWWGMTMRK